MKTGEDDPIYRIRRRERLLEQISHVIVCQGELLRLDDWLAQLGIATRSPKWKSAPTSDEAQQRVEERLAGVPSVRPTTHD